MVVLALPRGGVPVAAEVAAALHAPLDVFVVRKLGVPGQPELAMGAVASGGLRVVNEDVLAHLPWLREADLDAVVRRELAELHRREDAYRAGRPQTSLTGRTVILVDDGIATGASMRAAVRAVKARARRVIVAVPVAPREVVREFAGLADEVVVLHTPARFGSVGGQYADFRQLTDSDVREVLTARG